MLLKIFPNSKTLRIIVILIIDFLDFGQLRNFKMQLYHQ
jgi:hypothetical protein